MSADQEVNTTNTDKIRKQFPLEVFINQNGNITIKQAFGEEESLLQLHYSQASTLAAWIVVCALEAEKIQ